MSFIQGCFFFKLITFKLSYFNKRFSFPLLFFFIVIFKIFVKWGQPNKLLLGGTSAQLAKVHLEGGPALDRLVHPELPPKIFQHQQFQSFYYDADHRN